MKNLMSKKTTIDKPYIVFKNNQGWTWLVLKSNKADTSAQYASAFCAVSSPFTYGGYDYGDVYWSEILSNAVPVAFGAWDGTDPDDPDSLVFTKLIQPVLWAAEDEPDNAKVAKSLGLPVSVVAFILAAFNVAK